MTSQNPAYPDAHPTAPGGMSKKNLIKELVNTHGYESDPEAWAQVSWPDLIDMVCEERLAREAEERPEPDDADDTERIEAEPEVRNDLDIMADEEDYANPFEPMGESMFDILDEEELPDGVVYDDPACKCGTEESAHDRVDPPHSFVPQGYDEREDAGFEADHPDEIERLLTELDGAPVAVVEEVLHDAGVDSDVLDPEQMFAEMAAAREEATPPPLFLGIPGVKDYVFDNHAGAGPSGAERWMNCTMSLSLSREFLETLSPNQQRAFASGTTAARQGTTAHAVGEVEANMVLGRVSAEEVEYTLMELSVLPEDEGEAYDDEMAEYVAEYVDLVKSYAQERGNDHILIESRGEAGIPLTDMHEGEVYVVRGSADFVGLPVKGGTPETKSLVVGDLKYGEGKDVDVDENPQIRLYALAMLELLADEETGELPMWVEDVVYHIIQPRLGGIKTWTETIDDLLTWRDEVLAPALTKALYGQHEGATFEPSELACQWCPARGSCPALTEQRVESAAGLFDTIVDAEFTDGPGAFPETTLLPDDKLGELLTMVAGLHSIYKDLKAEAQRRLHRGGSVPGYQLVNYTPRRTWKGDAINRLDPALTVEEGRVALPDETLTQLWTNPTLVSPTVAEKVLGKEVYPQIESLVIKPDKVPVIAPEGDRRKTWEGKPPEAMFDIEEEA